MFFQEMHVNDLRVVIMEAKDQKALFAIAGVEERKNEGIART